MMGSKAYTICHIYRGPCTLRSRPLLGSFSRAKSIVPNRETAKDPTTDRYRPASAHMQ